MKSYVTIYTKEDGKREFTSEEWIGFAAETVHFHREDGPAIEYQDMDKYWFYEDKLHRLDGPAQSAEFGNLWHIDDEEYSKEEFDRILEEVRNMSLTLRLTDPRWWVREFKE